MLSRSERVFAAVSRRASRPPPTPRTTQCRRSRHRARSSQNGGRAAAVAALKVRASASGGFSSAVVRRPGVLAPRQSHGCRIAARKREDWSPPRDRRGQRRHRARRRASVRDAWGTRLPPLRFCSLASCASRRRRRGLLAHTKDEAGGRSRGNLVPKASSTDARLRRAMPVCSPAVSGRATIFTLQRRLRPRSACDCLGVQDTGRRNAGERTRACARCAPSMPSIAAPEGLYGCRPAPRAGGHAARLQGGH